MRGAQRRWPSDLRRGRGCTSPVNQPQTETANLPKAVLPLSGWIAAGPQNGTLNDPNIIAIDGGNSGKGAPHLARTACPQLSHPVKVGEFMTTVSRPRCAHD